MSFRSLHQLLGGELEEPPSIVQARKLVRYQHGLQLLFEQLFLRDVLYLTDKVERVASGITDQGDAQRTPHYVPVPVVVALFEPVIGYLVIDQSLGRIRGRFSRSSGWVRSWKVLARSSSSE